MKTFLAIIWLSSACADFLPYGADSNGNPRYSTIESKSWCTQGSMEEPCTQQFRCPWLNAGSDLFFSAAKWDKQNQASTMIHYINDNVTPAFYTIGTTGGNFPISQSDKNQIGSCWHVKGAPYQGFGSFNGVDIILQDEGMGGSDSNADICSIQGGCGDYNCCKVSIPDVGYKADCQAGTTPGYMGCGPAVAGELIENEYGNFTISVAGGCWHQYDGQDYSHMKWGDICSAIYGSDPLYTSCLNEGPFMATGADPVMARRVRCPEGLVRLSGMVREDNTKFDIAQMGTDAYNSSYWEGGSKTVSNGGDCRIDSGNYNDAAGLKTHMIFCAPQKDAPAGPIDDLSKALWGGNSAQVAFANEVASNDYLKQWSLAYGSIPVFYSSSDGDWTNEIDAERLCY